MSDADVSDLPRPPRYDAAGLHGLVGAVARALSLPGLAPDPATAPLVLPEGVRSVVVLVVDGLGHHQLRAHPDVAAFLNGQPSTILDAPYPTSTVTSLSCIGTGLPPGQHGLVGYATALPDDDRPLILLTWSWERQDLGIDARDEVPPEEFQPLPTAFEQLAAAGVRVTTVLRPEFGTSGLTRAGLRGGAVRTATDLAGTLDAAIGAAAEGAPLVYAHHGDLDAIGHVVGPDADPWRDELARIDQHLAERATRLPEGVAVVVTADHGMVGISPEGYVELADRPELLDGVRVLAGEPRARQLHLRRGATADVMAAWREATAGQGHVCTREEAIEAGWFGPVAAHVRPRIGDVLVTATVPDVAWIHRDRDAFGGRLVGMHGALTPAEVEVPAVVLTRR